MSVAVYGLDALEGETAFAFVVLRLRAPVDRAGLLEVLRYAASLIPDADAFIDEFPTDLEGTLQLVGIPWLPPEAGHGVTAQRRLIEGAGAVGVDAAWFFQTGTSLPSEASPDDDDDDDDDDEPAASKRASTTTGETRPESTRPPTPAETWGWGGDVMSDTQTQVELDDETVDEPDVTDVHERVPADDDDDDADPDDAEWSYGPPPQALQLRFPVDNYPAILDELDREDFGIAIKLAGAALPGENTVLLAFHTLWLAPYGDRYRNTAVTIDLEHHAAHLWVDRFAVPCSAAEQVHHLMWIVAMIDKVVPIVHARFVAATMAQKYSGVMGEANEPFVLGGNPLLAVHAEGGEAAVDAWLATQIEWSKAELAQMLRELAVEIMTSDRGEIEADEDDDDAEDQGADIDDDDDDDDDDEGGDDDGDHAPVRQIASGTFTAYSGELLLERARAGILDARALEPLTKSLGTHVANRAIKIDILGAARYTPAVGMIMQTGNNAPDAAARALVAINDPIATPALAALGTATAADAMATLLVAHPNAVASTKTFIARVLGDAPDAMAYIAYGRLARTLKPHERVAAKHRLVERDGGDDMLVRAARNLALMLASPAAPPPLPPPELRPELHAALTESAHEHAVAVKRFVIALRIADIVVDIVDPADVVWLTRFAEPELRAAAHALLAKLGKPLAQAPMFDADAARALDDAALVAHIADTHVVGRAALIAEASRRELAAARRPIIDACHDAIARAPAAAPVLDHDARVLEVGLPALVPLDTDAVKLFDRVLRHSNPHVKAALVRTAPRDPRLLGGMFHVLGERAGWQEHAARRWLARYKGTAAYEAERRRLPPRPIPHAAIDDEGTN